MSMRIGIGDILTIRDIVLAVYKFVRRVQGKLREAAWGLQAMRSFGIWTWIVFSVGMPVTFVFALLSIVLTRNLMMGLAYFAVWTVLLLFLWLSPFTVSALKDMIHKTFEP